MRRHLQQGSSQLVGLVRWLTGRGLWLLLSLVATTVYLFTLDRSSSWWDCGEFIATGWLLQVGHPPGAPFYQLLQHLFMLLSFGNTMLVAPLSNALSAVASGFTVGLIYLTLTELTTKETITPNSQLLTPNYKHGAAIGALCYLFCDTVWFSAVESEVYALAMLFCALDVYLMLRWRRTGNWRLVVLTGLLLGLGVCVHLMTLLVLPALLLVYLNARLPRWRAQRRAWLTDLRCLALALLLFVTGLSPYLIVPIRAAANPPINEMKGSFGAYLQREQYAKAPLYPRMWRERDADHWREWTFDTESVAGNAAYYVTYQLGYMYGRYLMYNYIGRENEHWGFVVPFVLPALLAAYGLWRHRRRNRFGYWVVMLLFLMGGVVLNLYLNHPCYEPRERDYVYVLSLYALALWIGVGASEICHTLRLPSYLLLLAPLTLAVGNWSDHDRSHCHSVHDISLNHLQSCDPNAVLITLGDNDTFPLWYLQQVEGRRTDIDVYNIGLTGWSETMQIIGKSLGHRPVYVSLYFYDRYASYFGNRLRCEGFCWRLLPDSEEVDSREPLERHLRDSIEWHITPHEYLDRVSRRFIRDWEHHTGTLLTR